jgi:DNA adenine methylase
MFLLGSRLLTGSPPSTKGSGESKFVISILPNSYLHATRSTTGEYGPQEMTEDQHLSLINRLAGIKGKFMLSGYPSKLYEHAEWVYKWKRHEKRVDNHASSAKIKERKTECIWCNYE